MSDMKAITLAQAAKAAGGTLIGGGENLVIRQVVMDSRLDVEGALFVAIAGSRADGHDYAAEVLRRGALACLVEREIDAPGPYILVDSTLRAIRDLAGYYRRLFSIPVIGITGSVGKTGTKEMIASVLSTRFRVHKTAGNLNNEIGVPMTLFALRESHQVAVMEMGISDFGEMSRLTEMVRPDIAMITIIGYAHLENLIDRAGVLKAKTEIFKGLPPHGLALVNGDDDLLAPFEITTAAPDKTEVEKRLYGLGAENDYRAVDIVNQGEAGTACTLLLGDEAFPILVPAFGQHMIYTALAAAVVGHRLGLTPEEITRGISAFQNADQRAEVSKTDHLTIIDDSYNANPDSVKAALTSLGNLSGKRVAILGDMGELGENAAALHYQVGSHAAQCGIDRLICVGEMSKSLHQGALDTKPTLQAWYFPEKEEAIQALPAILQQGDQVLVKASRFMRFEEIVAALKGM